MTPSNGMRFNSQWNDNYAIVKGDILYINFLVENTNGAYYKENTPHTLCKIKKPKSVKIGNRLSLSGYALSSSGAARANSGQVSLYTGTQDNNDLEVVFLTTDIATYKINITGAVLLRQLFPRSNYKPIIFATGCWQCSVRLSCVDIERLLALNLHRRSRYSGAWIIYLIRIYPKNSIYAGLWKCYHNCALRTYCVTRSPHFQCSICIFSVITIVVFTRFNNNITIYLVSLS